MTNFIKLAAISSVLFAGSAMAASYDIYPTNGSQTHMLGDVSLERASATDSASFQDHIQRASHTNQGLYNGSK